MRRKVTASVVAAVALAAVLAIALAAGGGRVQRSANVVVHPLISNVTFVSADASPPSEAACNAVGRRCFNPTAMANSYDYATVHAAGNEGQGKTIAIIDSFGASTIRNDLSVFDHAWGLPDPCGAGPGIPSTPDYNCPASTPGPRFDIECFHGCPPPVPPPPNNGTGLEAHSLWDVEVALDVEWAHATAPLANILLVTTPTAEVLGMQGFQQMMNAEQSVIDNHQADVISQSFGAGEGTFNNGLASLKQLRQSFVDAQQNNVTVFAATGDNGTANPMKTPVKNPGLIPYPSVGWPASDPLVTAVGGTYLCTDGVTGLTVDTATPPVRCEADTTQDRETGWVASGGGYSIVFPRPDYQNTLPAGSTYVGSSPGAPGPNSNMRGIPDIAYQASATTGVLVYLSEAPDGAPGEIECGGSNPCQPGWYVVGGTSSGSPQWAGIAAMADVAAGHDLGFLNPLLYKLASNPTTYARDFYDVTKNSNQLDPTIPGWSASTGWDAVTGLGTPDVANLIQDLKTATP